MATERGIVVETSGASARVRTLPQEACDGCPSCGTCGAQRESAELEVLNPVGARPGDRIVVDLDHRAFLKVTFLLYVLPVVALMAGAAAGLRLAGPLGWSESAASAACGFLGFGASLCFIRFQARRMAADRAYRARITRILPAAPPPPDRAEADGQMAALCTHARPSS